MKYFTKKTRILVVDTETANMLDDPLIYDIGWAVTDVRGNIYETASYVNRDIFYGEKDLMNTAYYSNKIDRYIDDLKTGSRSLASTLQIKESMIDVINRYNIEYIAAYNARFDARALNCTIRWISKSLTRYFLKNDQVEWLDIMKMAQDAVVNTQAYKTWALDMGYIQKNGAPRKTAEMLYQYITGQDDFIEEHTGLADVLIEAQIMAFCFSERTRRKVKMRTRLWKDVKIYPDETDFQRALRYNLKLHPCL